MLAFPIVLMLVLGTALSDAFNSDSHSIKDIQVLYKDEASSTFSQSFEAFTKEVNRVFILKIQAAKTRFYGLLCGCNDDDDCTICCDGSEFF